MNRTLQKFSKLAESANLSKKTLRSKETFLKMARSQGEIGSLNSVTQGLDAAFPLKKGMLVTFEYNAKYGDTLPYWDRYPLILVTELTRTGWYGLNLHYLHPRVRARIFYDLQTKGIPIIDNEMANLCIKRYLAELVTGIPKKFPKEMWEIAVHLPYENFQKANAPKVWRDTGRKK